MEKGLEGIWGVEEPSGLSRKESAAPAAKAQRTQQKKPPGDAPKPSPQKGAGTRHHVLRRVVVQVDLALLARLEDAKDGADRHAGVDVGRAVQRVKDDDVLAAAHLFLF